MLHVFVVGGFEVLSRIFYQELWPMAIPRVLS